MQTEMVEIMKKQIQDFVAKNESKWFEDQV